MNDHNPFLFPGILICAVGLLVPVVLTIFPPPNLVRYQEPQDNNLKHSEIVTAAYAKGEAKLEQAHMLFHDLKTLVKKADEQQNEARIADKYKTSQ